LPKRKIVIVADSSFAALDLIAMVRRHVCLVTRLRLDANLFAPAPKRRPGQRGRTAKKGRPLPKLSKVLENKTTRWTRLSMPYWYGDERCILEIATGTAIWYHSGLPPAPVRWVLFATNRVTGLGAWGPHVERLALPKSVDSGNLSLNKLVIRWMSV
jgi:hypothetical protein